MYPIKGESTEKYRSTKKKKNLLESFRKTNTAYVPCYKKKAFEIADRPVATLQLWSQSTSLRNGPDYRIQQICDN